MGKELIFRNADQPHLCCHPSEDVAQHHYLSTLVWAFEMV